MTACTPDGCALVPFARAADITHQLKMIPKLKAELEDLIIDSHKANLGLKDLRAQLAECEAQPVSWTGYLVAFGGGVLVGILALMGLLL